jgi:hypothetical protein
MPMELTLTTARIDAIFDARNKARWLKNLGVYEYLLRHRNNVGSAQEASATQDYERNFNYFYQVRRNAEWRKKFYALFYGMRGNDVSFEHILRTLLAETGKVEASFSSKLAATLDPTLPVIDRHVLSYVGARLPMSVKDPEKRIGIIVGMYTGMGVAFNEFLTRPAGRHLVARFKEEYPETAIHEMKMLDLVLWQSGGFRGDDPLSVDPPGLAPGSPDGKLGILTA